MEEIWRWSDKKDFIKKFLSKFFKRASATSSDEMGLPISQEIVLSVDPNNNPFRTLTDVQLFYVLQEKFKDILADKKSRDELIKQAMIEWYKEKKEGGF